MKPSKKKQDKSGKKEIQKERKKKIIAWLKPYLESGNDEEANTMWDQLKAHGEAKEWAKFGNVIRQKWLKKRNAGDNATTCLDNSQHCLNIWDLLKNVRGIAQSDACAGTDANSGDPSNELTGEGTGVEMQTSNSDGTTKDAKPKKTLSKQRQRKDILMKWLKPYMETKPDDDAHRMWNELMAHGEAKEWRKFGNVIRKKYVSTGHSEENATCLSNSQHCMNIWDLLTGGNRYTGGGSAAEQ